MSKLNTIIKSLPFRKITSVYLIGSENDFYRLYLVGGSNAVRVDLKKNLIGNFTNIEKSLIFKGNLTQKVKPKDAVKFLEDCNYNGCPVPSNETLEIVLKLLEHPYFQEIKKNKDKETFFSWLKKQDFRDDLIGDLVSDILKDAHLSGYESYDEINERINKEILFKTRDWDINSFRENKQEGMVNPLLVLKLAKLEYDVFKKQLKLKKFAIRNTSGFVYFFRYEKQPSPIKIGRSKNIESRKKQLQTSLPYDLITIGYIQTNDYFKLEDEIHQRFHSKRIKPNREWFDITKEEAIEIVREENGQVCCE